MKTGGGLKASPAFTGPNLMTFNLTAHLARQRINIGTLAVKIAAREILQCPDEQKRWRAMHALRKLQALVR